MKETKKAFLRRLGRALFWRLPSGEAHAIVEDYSGFFDDRMTEGKTEAEVCREFGAPTEVARAILRESGRRTQPLGLLIVVWVLLVGFLNWWWTWQTFRFSNSGYFWFYVAEFLLIPVLWLCWRRELDGRKDELPTRGAGVLRPLASRRLLGPHFIATTPGACWSLYRSGRHSRLSSSLSRTGPGSVW